MNRAAAAMRAANSSMRVSATLPIGLGLKAVTSPQQLSKKSSGIEAGRLPVRYLRSKSTPPRADGGTAGRVTNGKFVLRRKPSGRRYASSVEGVKTGPYSEL